MLVILGLIIYTAYLQNYVLALSFAVILAMLLLFSLFEKDGIDVQSIVLIAIMTALAIVGRSIFYYIPQFKPIIAIAIITGVGLGKKAGFLCGSLSMLVSNFLFGQGLWTIWQMFALGLVGLISGFMSNSRMSKSTVFVCAWGAVASIIYGVIVDTWTLVAIGGNLTISYAITIYLAGLIFNLILAVASVIFLALLYKPLIKSLNRAKTKYGLIGSDDNIYDINNYQNKTE